MAKSIPTTTNDKLIGTASNDTVDGLAGNDTLTGLGGSDRLRGGIGADSIDGGVGNDLLFGDAGNDTLIGAAGNDVLDGGADNDRLDGGAGADTLIGGTGIDTLIGGDHNDFYIVDHSQDVITEKTGTKAGLDSVQSSVDYILATNLENLTLTGLTDLKGTGSDDRNVLTGNDGSNRLDGRNGNDTLQGKDGDDTLLGGGGVDQLIGGTGSDTYQISSIEDRIIETAADDGDDVVESSISYTLGAHLEVLTLTGSNPLDGTGNELGNLLEGNGAANNLSGEAGDDTLQGNDGDDTLRGGAGDDIIAGGDGTDQVVYLGQKDDYKITYDADSDGWIVEDANGTDGDGTDEGRDELSGIESMLFADKGVIDLTQGLSLSIDNISQIEGTGADTAFNFTVSLSAASSSPVSVNYSVQSGTASAGTDFTPVSGVLTFSPDETEKTIRVPVKADTLTEADETFTVVLSNPIGASLVQASGTGTIQNDDQTRLAISAVSLNEGNGGSQDAILTVTLSSAASQPVTVAYATADGTAVAGSDYTASTGTVTFPAGSTSQQIRIPVGGDTAVETDESFSVTLSKPGNAVIATASAAVTLKNDDQAVLSIASTQISEGNAGSQNVDLTLTLSAPASQSVTVDYTTVNGTALAGSDYTAKTGTVTFPAGTIRQTISIPVSGDKVVEANETFSVTLGRARNATVSSVAGSAAVTLINDDQPVLSLADVRLNEGNSGSNEAVITVSLSGASPQVVTVDYTTANFSAVAGSDYTASTGTLSFPAGSTSQQIRIPVSGDTVVETDEQFIVSLSNAKNASLTADDSAVVTLTNDDIPSLTVAAVQVQEGNSGTTEAVVTVSLSSASSQAVSVNYGTVDGTALAGSDYSPASGNLSFAPGETTQQIRVLVNGDTEAEADETFTLNLSEAAGAILGNASRQAIVTLRNDDRNTFSQPSISVANSQTTEGNSGSRSVNLTISLSGSTTQPVRVEYTTINGTAMAGSDYTARTGTLTFAAGITSQEISIPVLTDSTFEAEENFTVTLRNPQNATLSRATALVTIVDDDPSVEPLAVITNEGTYSSTIRDDDGESLNVYLEAGTYQIEMRGNPTGDGSLSDPIIRGLYDSDGNALSEGDDDGGTGANAMLSFTADSAGLYTLNLDGLDSTGSYRLVVSQQESAVEDEPFAVITNEGTYSSTITDDDGESLNVYLEAGTYQIEMRGNPTGDGSLSDPIIRGLYDSDGNELSEGDDDGGTGVNAMLGFTADSAGLYTLNLDGLGGSTGSYRLVVSQQESAVEDEPFAVITNEGTYSSTITDDDGESLNVYLEAGTYQIEMRGNPTGDGSLSDPIIRGLYDSDGNELSEGDDDGGTGVNAMLSFTADSDGLYTLNLDGLGGSTGSYRLVVSREADASTFYLYDSVWYSDSDHSNPVSSAVVSSALRNRATQIQFDTIRNDSVVRLSGWTADDKLTIQNEWVSGNAVRTERAGISYYGIGFNTNIVATTTSTSSGTFTETFSVKSVIGLRTRPSSSGGYRLEYWSNSASDAQAIALILPVTSRDAPSISNIYFI